MPASADGASLRPGRGPHYRAAMTNRGRSAYLLLAIVAWVGVALGLFVTFSGLYPTKAAGPTSFTNADSGLLSGIVDYCSYFTHVSNWIVAIVATILARTPDRAGRIFNVLIMDALVMISVTGIVYNVLLAPVAPPQEGLEIPSNIVQHIVTPLLMVIVFLVAGPRGRFTWRTPFAALVIPLAYAVWTLLHGAVVGAYPYGILDVATYGYGAVLGTLAEIVVLGVVLGFAFLGLDRLLSRSSRSRATH